MCALISCGWDPGLFSLNRLYANCILPQGTDYTFWGRGVSQGHSDALRRIPGVADARQYTIPVPAALEAVRAGGNPQLTTRQKHTRECWVVLEEGADAQAVEKQIVEMPNYFDEYDVTVHFINQEELDRDHAGLPHGGFVIRTGTTAGGNDCRIEYSLDLGSNPEFTACVLVSYARAVARLASEGANGLQDRVRHRARLPLARKRRGAARPHAVRARFLELSQRAGGGLPRLRRLGVFLQ